jgi:hypothetical protein
MAGLHLRRTLDLLLSLGFIVSYNLNDDTVFYGREDNEKVLWYSLKVK